MRLTARGYPASPGACARVGRCFVALTVNDIRDKVCLEAEINYQLDKLLGDNLYAYTEVRSNSVRVKIYGGRWSEGIRVLSRLDYDLTVLEPGVEEAAKRIHLDWLFS